MAEIDMEFYTRITFNHTRETVNDWFTVTRSYCGETVEIHLEADAEGQLV
jgi:hypothetical protein